MKTLTSKRMPSWHLSGSAALALALVACGGGSDNDSNKNTTAQPGKVSLTGVVSKGVMVGADVKAYAVKADGTVDRGKVLASAVSTSGGAYALPAFELTSGTPVVVEVSVNASTSHTDEATGSAVPLPVGMTLRAAIVPKVVDNQTTQRQVSLTPFTEMAVKAAERDAAKLSSANIAQANSTVQQLLGFDPVGTEVKPLDSDNSVEQKAYQVMLTSVAQMAHDQAVGCADANAGVRIQCVVGKLADAAQLDSLALVKTGNVDVTAALKAAVTTTVNTAKFSGAGVTPATVGTVVSKLDCATTNTCEAATPTTESAIAAAKAMFAGLRTDMSGLLTRGGVAGTGGLNVEAAKFQAASRAVQVPAELVQRDLKAVLLGIGLYQDFQSGATTTPSRSKGYGDAQGFTTDIAPDGRIQWVGGYTSQLGALGCTLYTTSKNDVKASTPAEAKSIGCRASARAEITRKRSSLSSFAGTVTIVDWRHGFTLTPTTTAGRFDYASSAQRRTREWTCDNVYEMSKCTGEKELERANLPELPGNAPTKYVGTIDVAVADAEITYIKVSGELPGELARNDGSLLNHHHRWNVEGSLSRLEALADANGQVDVFNDDTVDVAGTLELKAGSRLSLIDLTDAGTRPTGGNPATNQGVGAGTLILSWTTPTAQLAGTLTASTPVWDQSGSRHVVENLVFDGSLRTSSDGGKSYGDVITAKLTASVTGYAGHRADRSLTASNTYTGTTSIAGVVQAPGRPALKLNVSASQPAHLSEPTVITGSFQTGTRHALQLSMSRNASGLLQLSLAEPVAKLSMQVTAHEASSQLLHDQTVIGTLDHTSGRMTYVDGSFESLDIGL